MITRIETCERRTRCRGRNCRNDNHTINGDLRGVEMIPTRYGPTPHYYCIDCAIEKIKHDIEFQQSLLRGINYEI